MRRKAGGKKQSIMFNDMAMALDDFEAMSAWRVCGKVKAGQRLHGVWMPDGLFYFPMSEKNGKTAVCFASRSDVGPIIEN